VFVPHLSVHFTHLPRLIFKNKKSPELPAGPRSKPVIVGRRRLSFATPRPRPRSSTRRALEPLSSSFPCLGGGCTTGLKKCRRCLGGGHAAKLKKHHRCLGGACAGGSPAAAAHAAVVDLLHVPTEVHAEGCASFEDAATGLLRMSATVHTEAAAAGLLHVPAPLGLLCSRYFGQPNPLASCVCPLRRPPVQQIRERENLCCGRDKRRREDKGEDTNEPI
jgi:hypothetical protein